MIGYVLVNFTLPRGKTLNRRVAYTYEAVKSSAISEIVATILRANSVSRAQNSRLCVTE